MNQMTSMKIVTPRTNTQRNMERHTSLSRPPHRPYHPKVRKRSDMQSEAEAKAQATAAVVVNAAAPRTTKKKPAGQK
jgi:hypothetical protein